MYNRAEPYHVMPHVRHCKDGYSICCYDAIQGGAAVLGNTLLQYLWYDATEQRW